MFDALSPAAQSAAVLIGLAVLLMLFLFSKWRYDISAVSVLLALALVGAIAPKEVFAGFSHPAVVTLASVLVISRGFVKTGLIDRIVALLLRRGPKLSQVTLRMMLLTAALSGIMNNIGALALILPVAMQVAKERKSHPSLLLMPLSFSSLLGGMLTGIGTPPNMIVSGYRAQVLGQGFSFFAFTPASIVPVFGGILLMYAIGRFVLPKRPGAKEGDRIIPIEPYLSEFEILAGSMLDGAHVYEISSKTKAECEVLSVLREGENTPAPAPSMRLRAGDILVIKASPEDLHAISADNRLALRGMKTDPTAEAEHIKSADTALVEVVLKNDSPLIGRTAFETRLRNRYNVNLVALSRRGSVSVSRLKLIRFRAGDVLLLQAPTVLIADTFRKLSALPLMPRELPEAQHAPAWQRTFVCAAFLTAVLLATFGVYPIELLFSAVAVSFVLTKILSPRDFYRSIEWPSVLLLGSLLPIGGAFARSGGADIAARALLGAAHSLPPEVVLGLLMLVTMLLSNVISTSATAVLAGPIALYVARSLSVRPDAFLLGIAIAASSSFLTPIGHQTNLLVMGPGGYTFRDYWPLGLPLSIFVLLSASVLLPRIFPL